jgi:Sugar (pentulose and hexulose) kinases
VSATVTVDIGTTGVKLCVFSAEGVLLASDRHRTPTVPDAWGEVYDLPALMSVVESFMMRLPADQRHEIGRIAFTSVGESGGLVRKDLSLASPMILWHDHRGAEHLNALDAAARTNIYRTTGLPANANYGISKTAWAAHRAGSIEDAQWLNIAEYLAAELTGKRWSEWSLASRTMALGLEDRAWSESVTSLFGLPTSVFPELRPATYGATIATRYAIRLGLPEKTSVHVAGHDHMVGAVGAELQPGELLNSTGTTEGLLFLNERPSLEPRFEEAKLANGIASTADYYTLFASIPTGGSAFETLQAMFDLRPDELERVIDELHEDYLDNRIDLSSVPLVVPAFRGSPPPTKDAAARGIVSGIHSRTTTADLVFGTFLGMVLQFADVLELFGVEPSIIKVIGPASRNPLWLQLKADLLNTELSVSQFPEVVSRGAHALANSTHVSWLDTTPRSVMPDHSRHRRLCDWSGHVRKRWEHLKATPR